MYYLQFLFPQVLSELQYFTSKYLISSLVKVIVLQVEDLYQLPQVTAMVKGL